MPDQRGERNVALWAVTEPGPRSGQRERRERNLTKPLAHSKNCREDGSTAKKDELWQSSKARRGEVDACCCGASVCQIPECVHAPRRSRPIQGNACHSTRRSLVPTRKRGRTTLPLGCDGDAQQQSRGDDCASSRPCLNHQEQPIVQLPSPPQSRSGRSKTGLHEPALKEKHQKPQAERGRSSCQDSDESIDRKRRQQVQGDKDDRIRNV